MSPEDAASRAGTELDGPAGLGGTAGFPGLTGARLEPGSVALIGGGPGALDLITVRGLALLQQADVVVVDRLGPTGLVDLLGADVEVVPVGKAPGRHTMPQREIEALIIERARRGQRVARLKGGDPFVLGRGGEEVLACRAAGIPVQVVPGVTSAIAGPATAGIPVTQRGIAVAVHVVNAHGDLGPADLAALRDPGTTTVLMMGVEWLPRLVRQALLNGVDPRTPAAIVQRATHEDQRSVHGTLETIVDRAEEEAIGHPAVIVVGQTAAAGLLSPPELPGPADASHERASREQGATGPEGGAGRDHLRAPQDEPATGSASGLFAEGAPVLIACAHGTRVREGRDVVREMLTDLTEQVDAPVREAYVDVQAPAVADTVAAVCTPAESTREQAQPEAVVVPVLLSTGYHVQHDIAAAVRGRTAVATGPLGPDPRLAVIMHQRLVEAGWCSGEAVVMAAAGSSDPAGIAMVEQMRDLLARQLQQEVSIGYAAASSPTVAEAVTQARAEGAARAGGSSRVAIASYMITPGRFQQVAEAAGADAVAGPLGNHRLLRQIILERYHAALGQ